ncbi:GDP-mannose 4,6-dehydratase [Ignavibacteria bacterium]|nr:GDP-mannose 4,6-dehydratase [Bacteroidota bacterium]MCZ2131627.1 GDP-mannose 4,6-dehydratase [Bacteroidota bacterium]
MKRALITGITGQDGSYLAEYLLAKGYEVHGIIRRASTFNTHRIDHIYADPHESGTRLHLHYGDLSDAGLITELIYNIAPGEVYHLAAQSHVRVSFDMPEYTGNITGIGVTRLLEAIRRSGVPARFYQASSSEMFGAAPPPQSETTAFQPQSPYAAAKVYGYFIAVNYREAYKLFACNGILFNHESPRRGEIFVTRKITRAVAAILAGKQNALYVGNLDARRDWGYAPEYVEMMHLMMQRDTPDDFVVGTGESHSVREFIERSFDYAGVEIEWRGEETEEIGLVRSTATDAAKIGDIVVKIDPRYFRPTEVDFLQADITKAERLLGWRPRVTFDELVEVMTDHDLLRAGLNAPGRGTAAVAAKGLDWTRHEFNDGSSVSGEI